MPLERDSANWNLPPDEIQRRRQVRIHDAPFFHLLTPYPHLDILGTLYLGRMDGRISADLSYCFHADKVDDQSVVNGRPAALAVQYTDCQFPEDFEAEIVPGKERDLSCQSSPPIT